jgi:ABC-type multidrug transport system ATPase subunit
VISEIRVTGVTKRYGPTLALRGVSTSFSPGLTVIEGPNGSGKSTLLGVIGQTVRPSSGQVAFSPDKDPVEARAEFGWVSHDSLCYGDLSGQANVELAARSHGLDARTSWCAAAERFELGTFATRKTRTNSRGQRQRVALARALVHSPSVVLLDEPTAGLDAQGVERLVRIVQQEVERGAIVVLVTHDPEAFAKLDGKAIRLIAGRLA